MGFFTDRERKELNKLSQAAGDAHEFVRPQQDCKTESEPTESDPGTLLQGAARAQVREIDVLITDLKMMREKLHSEASRVQQEVVEYATFSENALQSSKVICESLRAGLRPFQRHKGKGRSRARRKAARRLARISMRIASSETVERKRELQGD